MAGDVTALVFYYRLHEKNGITSPVRRKWMAAGTRSQRQYSRRGHVEDGKRRAPYSREGKRRVTVLVLVRRSYYTKRSTMILVLCSPEARGESQEADEECELKNDKSK